MMLIGSGNPPPSLEESARRDLEIANASLRAAERRRRGVEGQLAQDAESSMLHGDKAQRSVELYTKVKEKYAARMLQKGGVDNVLKDLEHYIIHDKLKDPARFSSNNPQAKASRKCSVDDFLKNDEGILQQNDNLNERGKYKAALRAIKDHVVKDPTGLSAPQFGSIFHEGSTAKLGPAYSTGTNDAREVLAYLWLAASDPEMELTDQALIDLPSREQCIAAEKENFLVTLAEIQRAHNDGNYAPYASTSDNPSCDAGAWGRMFIGAPLYNKLTKFFTVEVEDKPIERFPADQAVYMIAPKIVAFFDQLPLQLRMELINNFATASVEQNADRLKGYGTQDFAMECQMKMQDLFEQFWNEVSESIPELTQISVLQFASDDMFVVNNYNAALNLFKKYLETCFTLEIEKIQKGDLNTDRLYQPMVNHTLTAAFEEPHLKANQLLGQLVPEQARLAKLNEAIAHIQTILQNPNSFLKKSEIKDNDERIHQLTQNYEKLLAEKNALLILLDNFGRRLATKEVLAAIPLLDEDQRVAITDEVIPPYHKQEAVAYDDDYYDDPADSASNSDSASDSEPLDPKPAAEPTVANAMQRGIFNNFYTAAKAKWEAEGKPTPLNAVFDTVINRIQTQMKHLKLNKEQAEDLRKLVGLTEGNKQAVKSQLTEPSEEEKSSLDNSVRFVYRNFNNEDKSEMHFSKVLSLAFEEMMAEKETIEWFERNISENIELINQYMKEIDELIPRSERDENIIARVDSEWLNLSTAPNFIEVDHEAKIEIIKRLLKEMQLTNNEMSIATSRLAFKNAMHLMQNNEPFSARKELAAAAVVNNDMAAKYALVKMNQIDKIFVPDNYTSFAWLQKGKNSDDSFIREISAEVNEHGYDVMLRQKRGQIGEVIEIEKNEITKYAQSQIKEISEIKFSQNMKNFINGFSALIEMPGNVFSFNDILQEYLVTLELQLGEQSPEFLELIAPQNVRLANAVYLLNQYQVKSQGKLQIVNNVDVTYDLLSADARFLDGLRDLHVATESKSPAAMRIYHKLEINAAMSMIKLKEKVISSNVFTTPSREYQSYLESLVKLEQLRSEIGMLDLMKIRFKLGGIPGVDSPRDPFYAKLYNEWDAVRNNKKIIVKSDADFINDCILPILQNSTDDKRKAQIQELTMLVANQFYQKSLLQNITKEQHDINLKLAAKLGHPLAKLEILAIVASESKNKLTDDLSAPVKVMYREVFNEEYSMMNLSKLHQKAIHFASEANASDKVKALDCVNAIKKLLVNYLRHQANYYEKMILESKDKNELHEVREIWERDRNKAYQDLHDLGVELTFNFSITDQFKKAAQTMPVNPDWLVALKANIEESELSIRLNAGLLQSEADKLKNLELLSQFEDYAKNNQFLKRLHKYYDRIENLEESYYQLLEQGAPKEELDQLIVQVQAANDEMEVQMRMFVGKFVSNSKFDFQVEQKNRDYLVDLFLNYDNLQRDREQFKDSQVVDAFLNANGALRKAVVISNSHKENINVLQEMQSKISKVVFNYMEQIRKTMEQLQDSIEPHKESRASRQLDALGDALKQLNRINTELSSTKVRGMSYFKELATKAENVTHSLDDNLERIGPLKASTARTNMFKKQMNKILSPVGIELKEKKALDSKDLAKMKTNSAFAQAATSALPDLIEKQQAEIVTRHVNRVKGVYYVKHRDDTKGPLYNTTDVNLAINYINSHLNLRDLNLSQVALKELFKEAVFAEVTQWETEPIKIKFKALDGSKAVEVEIPKHQFDQYIDKQKQIIERGQGAAPSADGRNRPLG